MGNMLASAQLIEIEDFLMQDMILLGFLMEGEMTGYEIKKRMEESTTFFFNTSLGSIYPAFNKLEKNGLVTQHQSVENGRVKNHYAITDSGRRAFVEWLSLDAGVSKIKDEALLKIFFFSHLPEDQREGFVRAYLGELDRHIDEITKLRDHFVETRPKRDPFKMMPLLFGIDYYNFIRSWFEGYLEELD